jgi:hypothetical protein
VKFFKIPIFLEKKKRKKNCQDLGVGQNLTKCEKIPMSESLKFFINFFFQKKKRKKRKKKEKVVLRILIEFNGKF